jgi:hypothetical protein
MTSQRLRIALAIAAAVAFCACRREAPTDTEASGSPEAAAPGSGSAETPEAPAPGSGAAAPPSPTRPPVVRTTVNSADRELAIRLGLAPPEPLRIADLLTHADVREIMGYTGDLTIASLDGIDPDPYYNSLRLGSGTGFGFAAQLWHHDEQRQALSRFARLQETYIDRAVDTSPVGDEAFFGEFEGIRHYAFFHRASRNVAVFSCQSDLCTTEQARSMADRLASRL